MLHKLLSEESPLTPSQFHDITAYIVYKKMINLFNLRDMKFGRTPLMLAASNVELNITTLSLLLENGVDARLTDKEGKTFLVYAADGNKNGKLLHVLGLNGSAKPTLWEAITDENETRVKVLIWLGADVNDKNNRSETPLQVVAKTTSNTEFAIKTIKFLVDSGANVYNKDIDRNTFLHRFVCDGASINSVQFHDMVTFLNSKDLLPLFNIRNGHGETPFQFLVKNVEISTTTLALLKNNGVDFNAVDSEGQSVLYYATLGNRTLKLISDLVDLGANEKHLTNYNNTLLHVAAKIGNADFIKYFLDKGLDVNAPGQLGQTPLDYAFRYHQNSNVVQLLLKNGAKAPRNCEDIQGTCNNASGIYTIFPFKSGEDVAVEVYCDLVTDGGGWTVFQRRRPPISVTVDFERTWQEYAEGFRGSSIADSHWLGLNIISELTKAGDSTLRIDMTNWNNTGRFAQYTSFQVANEEEKFKLTVGGFSGNAGESLAYHNGMYFTTKDRDNDKLNDGNCALNWRGGWWYNACLRSSLNGLYLENGIDANQRNIHWVHWHGGSYSLKTTEMKLRSKNFKVPESCNEG